jgi:hypothetical protein
LLLQPVVGVNLVLKLRGDLPIIVKGRTILGRILVGCEDYRLA